METVVQFVKVMGLTVFCLAGAGCMVVSGFHQLNKRKQKRSPLHERIK